MIASTLSSGAASHTAIAVGASFPSTFASSGRSAMLHGITRNGLLPGTSLTVRKELSIRIVLAPTMIASFRPRRMKQDLGLMRHIFHKNFGRRSFLKREFSVRSDLRHHQHMRTVCRFSHYNSLITVRLGGG